jgi:glycosyltransferase involved in cell wall biosynthesis
MTGALMPAGSLAVLYDMTEEGWTSMDQMGHLLITRVPAFAPDLSVMPIHHRMIRLLSPGPLARVKPAFFADRVLNRMLFYPQRVKRQVAGRFDIYHVVDHSYAQLVLSLPPGRAIVTCHDIDTFRSIVRPAEERRNPLFKFMTRRILQGLRRAELIVCVSEAARDDLLRFNLADPARVRVVANGIDPALLERPSEVARARVRELLPPQRGVFDLLHVGNDVPRKRVDRVVEIIATLRKRGHWIRLVRVGSPLRRETRQRAIDLGFGDAIELPFVDPDVLRAVYERCDLLLIPSDREGYGLPVLEAFAAGKPVVASDIPALRETAGGLGTLVRTDALHDWVAAIEQVLSAGDPTGELAVARRARAARLTWDDHVRGLLPIYAELLDSSRTRKR